MTVGLVVGIAVAVLAVFVCLAVALPMCVCCCFGVRGKSLFRRRNRSPFSTSTTYSRMVSPVYAGNSVRKVSFTPRELNSALLVELLEKDHPFSLLRVRVILS